MSGQISDIIRKQVLSMEFMVLCNLTQLRREVVVSAINPKYTILSNIDTKDGKLFGTDLHQSLKDIETSVKLAYRLTAQNSSKSLLDRGQSQRPSNHRFQRTYCRNQHQHYRPYNRERRGKPSTR